MAIDTQQFHETFFEESFEGLDIMEAGLLGMNLDRLDNDTINAIFRAAHSIKGGAGTFGFTDVSSFTHAVETLLDDVREGQRSLTRDGVDILLESVDVLREMLTATRNNISFDSSISSNVQRKLQSLLGNDNTIHVDNHTETYHTNDEELPARWLIDFRPHHSMLMTGNDPILIIRELSSLGKLTIHCNDDKLPDIDLIIPTECYLSWQFELVTDQPIERLREVFEWVEDECDLDINRVNATNPADSNDISHQNKNTDTRDTVTTSSDSRNTQTLPPNTEASSIRVSIEKIDALINMVGELVITQSMMGQLDSNIDEFDTTRIEKLRDGLTQLERNTRELQESVMRIRMLPISFAFSRFPRMVHDISKKLNKKIELRMSGESTELDKTVMEKIGDPLVHLVRNSLDHGIEPPELRIKHGKNEAGVVHLNAYHKGGNIIIEISDDGAGLNKERIISKAIEKNIISADEDLTDAQVFDLIFHPGFSTAETVSDVSGRGVGMDVVKRNIRELGGNIDVRSQPGAGTTFTIRLPLTLAILDGQLLSVGNQTYIVPLVSIVESLQVIPDRVNTISGNAEVYKLRDEYIPILRLSSIFGIKSDINNLADGLIIVIEGDGRKVGVFVDELLGQQQVVIKSLESNFHRVEGVSGATILGDGTVALILDIDGLIQIVSRSKSNQVAA